MHPTNAQSTTKNNQSRLAGGPPLGTPSACGGAPCYTEWSFKVPYRHVRSTTKKKSVDAGRGELRSGWDPVYLTDPSGKFQPRQLGKNRCQNQGKTAILLWLGGSKGNLKKIEESGLLGVPAKGTSHGFPRAPGANQAKKTNKIMGF